jgi:GTP-binding protein EngB required for normal cell division
VKTFEHSRDALPRVCFVGRFKTGKSYLINALVGADVLPHDTDECTAHLVELAYGSCERASRLSGYDLDTAQETPLTTEQFKRAVDLTQMSEEEQQKVEDSAFRYYLPNSLLASCRLIDTPGFDGTNPEVRQRAEKAREQAIQQSSLCVLVVDKDAGEDQIKYARLIQQFAVPLVVVLNKSDQYDVEQIEEIQDRTISDLEQKVGVTPPFFACSARWQTNSAEDRAAIQYQRRYYDDENETEWHQWNALVKHLSRPQIGEKHGVLLTAIYHALELAAQVSGEYDLTRQAEAVFLNYLPRWRVEMSSLVGKVVLELAVTAAQSGKPLPWTRLRNFGIVPEDLAPKSLLPLETIEYLSSLYAETASEVVELAWSQHSAVLYRLVLSTQASWAVLLKIDSRAISELSQTVKRDKEDAEWYSQPLRTDFSYEEALVSLQSRWQAAPYTMDTDSARLRTRLAAALA